jgi:hypothetical protein
MAICPGEVTKMDSTTYLTASWRDAISSSVNALAIVTLLIGLPAVPALADGPPKLDVTPSCNAAARGPLVRDKQLCLGDEHSAEDILAKNWSAYNAADKTQCVGNVKTGGVPASYVELLSCLEVMRDAREIRDADQLAPVEQRPAASTRRRR